LQLFQLSLSHRLKAFITECRQIAVTQYRICQSAVRFKIADTPPQMPIDFKRNKAGPGLFKGCIEYDPNRTANIALLVYADGVKTYIIAPKGVSAGDELQSGSDAPIRAGNTLPLANIPVGTQIHCVEMKPGKGAQIARCAGTSAQLFAREGALCDFAFAFR